MSKCLLDSEIRIRCCVNLSLHKFTEVRCVSTDNKASVLEQTAGLFTLSYLPKFRTVFVVVVVVVVVVTCVKSYHFFHRRLYI